MAVTATPYGQTLLALTTTSFALSASDTYKVALMTSSYTAQYDTHNYYSDATGEVSASGTNYTTGGVILPNVVIAYDTTNHRVAMTGGPAVFSGVTLTARYAVIYKATGTAGTSRLISYVDFGSNLTYTGEDVQITFANGVLRLNVTVAAS